MLTEGSWIQLLKNNRGFTWQSKPALWRPNYFRKNSKYSPNHCTAGSLASCPPSYIFTCDWLKGIRPYCLVLQEVVRTPSSFMFLALPLFHLVLESGQPLDCEEFLAFLNESQGVIGCRFWTCTILGKHTWITLDCLCFQVHLAALKGVSASTLGKNSVIFQEIKEHLARK